MGEIASHTVLEGMHAVRLHGGPWDGKEVGVRDPEARLITVNGPRHGDHAVWVTHLYEWREGRYEFVSTDITPLSSAAWRINPRAEAREADEGPGAPEPGT